MHYLCEYSRDTNVKTFRGGYSRYLALFSNAFNLAYVLYLTMAKSTSLLPKVTLIYDPSQRSIAAIPLPSSSRQRRIDSAGIETKLGMSNAARELLRVILPADSAQPAIFSHVLHKPFVFCT